MPNGSSPNSFTLPGPPGAAWAVCFALDRLRSYRSFEPKRSCSPPAPPSSVRLCLARLESIDFFTSVLRVGSRSPDACAAFCAFLSTAMPVMMSFRLLSPSAAGAAVPSSFESSSDSVRFASPPSALATLRVAWARSFGRSSSASESESLSEDAFLSCDFLPLGRGRSTFLTSFSSLSVFIMASSSLRRFRAADDFLLPSASFASASAGRAVGFFGGFGLSLPSPGVFESVEKPLQDSSTRMLCDLCNLDKRQPVSS
uniref:Uncharacterized protein n=1 Tax=Anopheles merus TaxID=30066 RepID=A0A182VHA2_ANOME